MYRMILFTSLVLLQYGVPLCHERHPYWPICVFFDVSSLIFLSLIFGLSNTLRLCNCNRDLMQLSITILVFTMDPIVHKKKG
ncbi:hypothetical protein BDV33DRAFT_180357 [Aspergillus novoparasiticus]|uniref:Uncharacterized protein n=1 Tax=Aspergillus novoparasiticus TaxID=986946 RepID=A0A5N6EDS2_9EURO|nr:hypothetical protein BDV33DRAFT_180357 [Aspergillus novoparasiticus]